jgi:hypothetical protein
MGVALRLHLGQRRELVQNIDVPSRQRRELPVAGIRDSRLQTVPEGRQALPVVSRYSGFLRGAYGCLGTCHDGASLGLTGS